jgi:rubrerythrin
MIDMHEKAIQKYEGMLDKTNDADLKAWINQTLPHLRTHLDRVKACHEKIKDIS